MLELQEMLLVRHGESTANAKGIWQGQMEFPLSERGRAQASLAGHGLSSEPFEGLYSSPLSRAFETAEIIRDRAGFAEALSSIRALHPGGTRIVVVSHGGVMRAFLRKHFGPEVLPGVQRAANASITRLQWGETGPRLLEVASTAHLTEDPGAPTVEKCRAL